MMYRQAIRVQNKNVKINVDIKWLHMQPLYIDRKTIFHEFTLTYNKLSKGLCIFGVLSEERAPSSVIIPEPRVLPLTGERGPSSACSQNAPPECSSLCWDRNGLKVRSRGGGGTLEDER